MRLLTNSLLVLAIVAVVAVIAYTVYAQNLAVTECRARGFATGDAMIDGSTVCYRGELILPRR